jgi:hypothetical protein
LAELVSSVPSSAPFASELASALLSSDLTCSQFSSGVASALLSSYLTCSLVFFDLIPLLYSLI